MFKFLPLCSSQGERFTLRKLSSPIYGPPILCRRVAFERTIVHGYRKAHVVVCYTYDSPIKACSRQKTSLIKLYINKQGKSLSLLTSNRNDVKLEDGKEEGGGESMPQQQQDKRKKYVQCCPTSLSTALSFSSYFRHPRYNKSTYLWLSGCRRGTTRCFNTGKDDDTVDAAADNDAVVINGKKQAEKATTSRINPTPKKIIDGNTNAMVVDASTTARSAAFVYVAVDGLLSRTMKIEVTEGEDVLSIKDKIKEKKKNAYASYDADDLVLFKSNETTELDAESTSDELEIPLDPVGKALSALDEWNRNVTWGTKRQPLIVKVNSATTSVIKVSPWKNSKSAYVLFKTVF